MWMTALGNTRDMGVKVSFFPFAKKHTLLKWSKGRPSRGTECECDWKVYAKTLTRVLKDIQTHEAFQGASVVHVQADNASVHADTQEVVAAVRTKYAARVASKPGNQRQTQAPKSPDTNILDINIFRWLQNGIDKKNQAAD